MSLYPTFENGISCDVMSMYKDNKNNEIKTDNAESQSAISRNSTSQPLYPVLAEYFMGLDLREQAKKVENALISTNPNPGMAIPALPGEVTHGLRRMTLCKDAKGRVGLLVSAVDNGVFVSFVLENSPAALGGLRFGDQILQINDVLLAGYSADKVHSLIRKLPVNGINLIVRDRPFERIVSMHKDQTGHCGFQFHKGKVETLVKDSSAARNGLLTGHQILEIQGQNVIGMSDKEIAQLMKNAGNMITVTIIPSSIYEQMMKKLRWDFVKGKMDHSVHA